MTPLGKHSTRALNNTGTMYLVATIGDSSSPLPSRNAIPRSAAQSSFVEYRFGGGARRWAGEGQDWELSKSEGENTPKTII